MPGIFLIIMAVWKFIVLAVGLTAGYWLLVTSSKEHGWKKGLGRFLGWFLMLYAIVLASVICVQGMKIYKNKAQFVCPMQQMMQQRMQQIPQMQQNTMENAMENTMQGNTMQ